MEGTAPVAPVAGGEAPVTSDAPAPAPEPRKFKVKINSQEREISEADLTRDYELRQASHERMQRAAETEKQYNARMKKLDEDPWSYFKEKGIDPDKAAEDRLLKKLEFEMLSPEQKAIHKERQALAAEKAEVEQAKAAKAQWEADLAKKGQDELTLKAVQSIDQEIGQVLQATGLKPTRRVVARIAEVMLSHLDASEDGERLDAQGAFGRVQEEMAQEMGDYLQSLPIEKAVETLPKPFLDALRKFFLKQVQEQDPVMRNRDVRTPQNAGSGVRKRLTSTDSFFNRLEKKLK
jgi:hypothetical protein